jgi:hypothetical protein
MDFLNEERLAGGMQRQKGNGDLFKFFVQPSAKIRLKITRLIPDSFWVKKEKS